MTQQGDVTTLVNEVEVDLGEAVEQFGGVEAFNGGRTAALATGMQKTLEDVKNSAAK